MTKQLAIQKVNSFVQRRWSAAQEIKQKVTKVVTLEKLTENLPKCIHP